MLYSCAMTLLSITSPIAKEGADVGRVERDGVGREGGVKSCYRDLNCASLCFTVAASMAHMKVKGSDAGEGTEKWRKIFVIAEGNMSLSRDTES